MSPKIFRISPTVGPIIGLMMQARNRDISPLETLSSKHRRYSSRNRFTNYMQQQNGYLLRAYLDWSTGIGTSGPITSERRGTLMGAFSRGWGGSWYLERSIEKGPVTGAGLGGGASACSAVGTGDDVPEPLDSVGVVEGGGACLDSKKERSRG